MAHLLALKDFKLSGCFLLC